MPIPKPFTPYIAPFVDRRRGISESPFEREQLGVCNCGHERALHVSGSCAGLRQGVSELEQCPCVWFAQGGEIDPEAGAPDRKRGSTGPHAEGISDLCSCGHVEGLHDNGNGKCAHGFVGQHKIAGGCACEHFDRVRPLQQFPEMARLENLAPLPREPSAAEIAALRLKAYEIMVPRVGGEDAAKETALKLVAWALGHGKN